jgi:hypothetical protein
MVRDRIRPVLLAAAMLTPFAAAAEGPRTRHVVLIVADGLRWQEVFGGAERELMDETCGGVEAPDAVVREFWRPTPEERRQALLPFLWGTVAREGQIWGNAAEGSFARVTNGLDFSYPGYNEMLSGAADPRMDTNDPVPNPNVTVFEWLNQRPGLTGRVSAYATWSVFDAIFNRARSNLRVCAGWRPVATCLAPPVPAMLKRLYETTTLYWRDNVWDSLLQASVLEEIRRHRPAVLFVGFGETDEWAHSGRYDLYLESARQTDRFIQELWETMQEIPEYRGTTTFLITTDHGRGSGPEGWKDHDREIPGSADMWIAVLGPDTPAFGERRAAPLVTQSQIAATVAALLGYDYRKAFPSAAPPLPDVTVARRQRVAGVGSLTAQREKP